MAYHYCLFPFAAFIRRNCSNFGFYAGGYTFHAAGIEGSQKGL